MLGCRGFIAEPFLTSNCVPQVISAASGSNRSSHAATLDASSRASVDRTSGKIPVSIAFLAVYGVAPGALIGAVAEARRIGVSPVSALLAGGTITERVYFRALAHHLALPFDDGGLQLGAGAHFPQSIASGVAPVLLASGREGWLIAPDGPKVEDLLHLAHAGRLPRQHLAITTPSSLAQRVRSAKERQIARHASSSLMEHDPAFSACSPPTPQQKLAGSSFGFLLPFALFYGGPFWGLLCSICGLVLSGAILLRIFATAASYESQRTTERALADAELPFYTIAIALHREEEVIGQLVNALDAIDYPRAKLDIKLIVEDDDAPMIEAIHALDLPRRYELIRAPIGVPRTKPRALNMALPVARGSLLVVFDAEDRPEPGQLRLAAQRFAVAPPRLACLQGSLVIDNANDNWLTRLFAIEYATLFDVFNPGLAQLSVPVPLGGTSNHFRGLW